MVLMIPIFANLNWGLSFCTLWVQDLEIPVFGSLSVNPANGNVICCFVDGNVIALSTGGSVIWKASTGGPIFSEPCISHSLPSQELGTLLRQHAVRHPNTSSAYVDEDMVLASDLSDQPDRLVCVCTSSGDVILLRINFNTVEGTSQSWKIEVQEFARLDLEGEIFSSPVMIGGKIFVGCQDDFVYCVGMEWSDSD